MEISITFLFHITPTHCIDDITLIGPNKKEIAASLDLPVGHLNIRGWDTNLTKFKDLSEIFRKPVSRHVKIFYLR